MLKSILKLNGAQELSKTEQESINGGGGPTLRRCCDPELHCCTFAGSRHAVLPCCTQPWSGSPVCYSTGGPFGVECI